jgi:ATP-dependent Lhr-like helicase
MAWDGRGDPDALVDILDLLFGYSAPAQSWEGDILPARLDEYFPLWLDGLFADHELAWVGTGNERTTFALASEVNVCSAEADPLDAPLLQAIEGGAASEHDLTEALGITREDLVPRLWNAAWSGTITTDSFAALRRGITAKFGSGTHHPGAQSRWPGRTGRRPRVQRPLPDARWQVIDREREGDPIERAELDRERARLLLRRYGLVFRELVVREGAAFAWGPVFRALRLMELSGEVVSGVFVRGVATPQFALRSALERLSAAESSARVVWMTAVDPASPCGLGLGDIYAGLPARLPGNHVVFRGGDLIMTSRRNGRELSFTVAPDDPVVDACMEPLLNLARRRWNPLPRVAVETINDLPVRESPFAQVLRRHGFRDEFKSFVLSASYR